jgi:uncharacterized membrane protein
VDAITPKDEVKLSPTEIAAISQLYRGEIHRAALWRGRLDTTTNWAVVTTGIALSVAFSSPEATPLPMVLVSFLLSVFLLFEAQRYRYFDVSYSRVRVLEARFFGPLLHGNNPGRDKKWNSFLARDYINPHFHLSLVEAVQHRLRRNYVWIFGVQIISYWGKIGVHPTPLTSADQLWARMAVGPLPGEAIMVVGAVFYGSLFALAAASNELLRRFGGKESALPRDHIRGLAITNPH